MCQIIVTQQAIVIYNVRSFKDIQAFVTEAAANQRWEFGTPLTLICSNKEGGQVAVQGSYYGGFTSMEDVDHHSNSLCGLDRGEDGVVWEDSLDSESAPLYEGLLAGDMCLRFPIPHEWWWDVITLGTNR